MTVRITPPVESEGFAERIQEVRSPGGIEAWLIEDHTLPFLSMAFGFRGGAALDPIGRAGTARMLADLLTESAGAQDEGAFRRALGDKAIRLFFSTQGDALHGRLQTLTQYTDRAFELLGVALRGPPFVPAAVARTRAAAAAQVRNNLANSDRVAIRSFFAHGFPDHAYGRPIEGDLDTLEAITVADIIGLHARMITRGNLRVAVVGAIGAGELGGALDRACAALPRGAASSTPNTSLSGLGARIVSRRDVPQSTIYFGRPGIVRSDPDFMAAMVANHCLGGSQGTSRLFKEAREKRGLCYAVWTALHATVGACTFIGSTSTPNARVGDMLDLIAMEIARLVRDGTGLDELEKAKSYLVGSHLLKLDSSAAIASLLLDMQFAGRDRAWLDQRNEQIAAVTQADVARAMRRLVGDGSMLIAIAGDPPLARSEAASITGMSLP